MRDIVFGLWEGWTGSENMQIPHKISLNAYFLSSFPVHLSSIHGANT